MMNWNTSTDCCNWNGVTCDYSTGDVISLDVSCGMLKGTIHPNSSLFNLPHLQKLNLAFNYFDCSQIPSEIGRFSNSLTHLNLSNCRFSGQVPPDITLLHKLVSLDLSSYGFLEYVNMTSKYPFMLLNPPYTGLKGKLPHYIFNLPSLEKLNLGGNDFTGSIPSETPINLTHLTYLRLSFNRLNGTLPSWLFTFPCLEYLLLRNNMFSGNVPFDSFALPSLKKLYLNNNNQLAGQIDVQTFRQLTNLTDLDLSYNNFSGELELDTLLSSLTNLEVLDLSYNGFSVTTKNANHYVNPGFLQLDLASCKLKVFPNSFRAMRKLEWLDLSSNEIHGQIPHWAGEIGGTYGLSYLNLSHNFITGMPQFQWYGLQQLSLQSNLIQGPFPPSICNMSELYFLDMSNNRFGGLIPQCFGNITSYFETIDMGNNSFQGTIPNIYGDCGRLEGLSLNGNQLSGEVPSSLSKCSGLRVLDLGNNHLIGTFPSWLEGLPNLQALVLKSNNFHGCIQPSSTVESLFPSLRVLDLSHNVFVGQLPVKYFQNFNSMMNVIKSNTTPEYLSMEYDDEEENGFTWKVVMLGYGCGTLVGLVMGYFMLSTRKVKWFNAIADATESLINDCLRSVNNELPHKLTNLESLNLSYRGFSVTTKNANHYVNPGFRYLRLVSCKLKVFPNSFRAMKQLEELDLSSNKIHGQIPHLTLMAIQ
ncbi:Leucine-rich repeat-containing protein [Artemisia annua]|uniref:Leucine-rich repeat-containing protein n=1 Tax=Artemisia annua TaxID=35608 RepID=A0A2U1PM80_ARTAN|nr:Leucine-rich repeat-containing protein [Artemisia annua]